MRRALVLGLARSGRAAAAALRRRGVEVVEADRSLGNDEDVALLDGVDVVVKSPGVPRENAIVRAARTPVWSEVELGYRLLERPLVGVTGTNGKTTTSELLGRMLGAPVAGNVGRALTDLDGESGDGWIVVELSSFQLEDIDSFRPRIAVLLNVEPDHLDRHGSFEAYRAAKLRIFENQLAVDTAIVPRGHVEVPGTAIRLEFAWDDPLPAEPLLRGAHNRENAVAATLAARAAGASEEQIVEALRTFRGVAHRLELVGEVGGVAYVNDSKATNVAAARRALAAYEDTSVHLILGGYDKGEDLSRLAPGSNVRRAYLIGAAADRFAQALDVAVERSGDLETAVRAAAAAAEPGDVVLLSPACASYDQFRDFEHRGEEFARLVRSLGR